MIVEEDDIATQTGRTWSEWFRLLDGWGAPERTSADIVGHLRAAHALDGTWASRIRESYHRTHHTPVHGGPLGGPHDIVVQRTIAHDAERMEAYLLQHGPVLDPALAVTPVARVTRSTRTLRFPGAERVEIALRPTAHGSTQVRLTHGGLPTRSAREAARERWVRALGTLCAGLDGA